ncbi:ABC-type glutathione transport system ATPase component [Paenibacillus mucilaginosus]|uniref:ABC transporter ATP-binding protein n=1 Tax=Paenibacillus mucilaginosus TaxID=61624 RepID=UPI003D1E25D6
MTEGLLERVHLESVQNETEAGRSDGPEKRAGGSPEARMQEEGGPAGPLQDERLKEAGTPAGGRDGASRAALLRQEPPVMELQGLSLDAAAERGKRVPILQDVSLALHPGQTLALVGESGSGKSMTAGAILGLLPQGIGITGGQLIYGGENVLPWSAKKRRSLCGREIGCVFQDYRGSFSPFWRVGDQLVETIRTHRRLTARQAKAAVLEGFEGLGLPPERTFSSYPFELSGGQLQRAAMASALLLQPRLLIADEPTTALDVLSGEKVLDLLEQLQRVTGCAVLLISHDLRQVLKRADRIAVMREGRIVESGRAEDIRDRAQHPYTRQLLEACPRLPGDGHSHGLHPETGYDGGELHHSDRKEAVSWGV